ncbi:MAG: transcription elongation factor GreA [Lachnospiraceae bacterium]|nr:transcription elongation factor GreA [Lachnospiraceae bacterium]
MAEEKKNIITYEGLKAREEELADLKINKRKEVAQKLKEARAQGDLSENAEYDAAKDWQRDIEARIEELENLLKNVEVIDDSGSVKDTVTIGKAVKLLDVSFDEEVTYSIVGSEEANSLYGRISNESPLGSALLGSRIGEIVVVETMDGPEEYKVLDITSAR